MWNLSKLHFPVFSMYFHNAEAFFPSIKHDFKTEENKKYNNKK